MAHSKTEKDKRIKTASFQEREPFSFFDRNCEECIFLDTHFLFGVSIRVYFLDLIELLTLKYGSRTKHETDVLAVIHLLRYESSIIQIKLRCVIFNIDATAG